MSCVPLHHDRDLRSALEGLLDGPAEILAVGEPTRGEPAVPEARNTLVRAAVALGVRSVALRPDPARPADRALLAWLRADDATREPADRVARHELTEVTAAALAAVRERDRHRGPTLVLAGTAELTGPGSGGAVPAALLGERYVVVAGSVGESGRLGLGTPPAGTFEAWLAGCAGSAPAVLVDAAAVPHDLRERPGGDPDREYAPLDAATLARADAVLHVTRPAADGVGPEDLTALVTDLPDVGYLLADERSGAPEAAWGSRFFFAGDDRMMPFATIVDRDQPGDDASRLDRPGVFRLNLPLGRPEFTRRFGFAPRDLAANLAGLELTTPDAWLPHPVYGTQGWACIVSPTTRRLPEIEALVRAAHARAGRRHERRAGARAR
jgi:hypothetical protein